MTQQVIGTGVCPDVAWRNGILHVVWGHSPAVWRVMDADGALIREKSMPTMYFPRTDGYDVYGHDGGRFCTWETGTLPHLGAPWGNCPVVVGPQDAYYQRASDIYPHGPEPRPTGLWRVRPDGTIERWDDAFSRLPWAGGLVHEDGDVIVAEAHDGGVDGRVNGIGFHLNGTAGSFWPRVAVEGERVAIVWDNRSLAPSTVNLWVGTKADLLAYPPLPLPVPSEPEPISPDPVEEPTPMRDFPLTDMLRQFAAKFPVPQLQPGEAIEALEERARQWTVRFCEQAACVSASYGAKRADPTRPISKDVLAWHGVAEFVGWDLLSGVGTGAPTLNDGLAGRPLPSTYDLTGQVFVPVNAKDWLGFYVTPQPVPYPIIPTPVTPDPATPVPAPAPTVPERDRLERSITAFCRAWLGV